MEKIISNGEKLSLQIKGRTINFKVENVENDILILKVEEIGEIENKSVNTLHYFLEPNI